MFFTIKMSQTFIQLCKKQNSNSSVQVFSVSLKYALQCFIQLPSLKKPGATYAFVFPNTDLVFQTFVLHGI